MGFVGFCIFGPRLVGIWHAPLGQDAVVCGTQVETAMIGFVKLQLWAALAGALVLLGLVTSLRSFWAYLFHPRADAPAAAPLASSNLDADSATTPPPATASLAAATAASAAPPPTTAPPEMPLLLAAPPAGPPAFLPQEKPDPFKTPAK